jgi:hypothetical protein
MEQIICKNTHEMVNGKCLVKCKDDKIRNENNRCVNKSAIQKQNKNNTSIIKCNPLTHEIINGKCLVKCKDNKTRNENNRCVNINKTIKINQLQKNNDNNIQKLQNKNKTVKCNLNTHEMFNGKCLVKCKDNKTRNENNRCITNKNKIVILQQPQQPQPIDLLIPEAKNITNPIIEHNYFDFIEKMQTIGETYQTKGVEYPNKNIFLYPLLIVNLMKKYNTKCIVLDKHLNVTIFDKNNNTSVYVHFMKQILNCIKENQHDENYVLIIPISIYVKRQGHANMLIYRHNTSTIEHFEPHGESINAPVQFKKWTNSVIHILQKIVNKMNQINIKKNNFYYKTPIQYIKPNELCPLRFGFQGLESTLPNKRNEGKGFCAMWSVFYAELILLNPKVDGKIILKTILKWINDEKNAMYVKNIIRGYVHVIHEEMNDILKTELNTNFIQFSKTQETFNKYSQIYKLLMKHFNEINTITYKHVFESPTSISITV